MPEPTTSEWATSEAGEAAPAAMIVTAASAATLALGSIA